MKIGILTFHRSYNYGAFMQCFSLLSRIKNDFPDADVEVIDYTSKRAMAGYEDALKRISDEDIREKIKKRNSTFDEVQKTLKMSDFRICSDDYTDLVEILNNTYDVIVVGSDAVWNWNVRGFPNIYFLKDFNGKKLSYAASVHGMNYQGITDEQRQYLDGALSDFEYIGVRDVTTENMVRFINGNLEANHNCDPTMFLDLNSVPCDMDKLKNKLISHGVDFSRPIIGVMGSDFIVKEIKKKYKDSVQIVCLYSYNKYADVFLYDLTPYEWARVFSFFKVTLTHFFHGTMLSLVNGVPVIPIEPVNDFSVKNTTKIKDLMTRMDLLDMRFELNKGKSLVKRLLYKAGIINDRMLWNNVCKIIDKCLENDYSEDIKRKVDNEKKCYESFHDSLKYIIDSGRGDK